MHKTITLETELSFAEALQGILDGKWLGIRPGKNTNYVELFKPQWMNEKSPDSILRWNRSDGDSEIRSSQYMEKWYPVVVDHRTLSK